MRADNAGIQTMRDVPNGDNNNTVGGVREYTAESVSTHVRCAGKTVGARSIQWQAKQRWVKGSVLHLNLTTQRYSNQPRRTRSVGP